MSKPIGLVEVSRPDGRWLIEGDMLKQTIRSFTAAELFFYNYDEKPLVEAEKNTTFWDALHSAVFERFVPDVKVIDMDFKKVSEEIIQKTENRFQQVMVSQFTNMAQTKNELLRSIEQGKRYKELYRAKMQNLQKRNGASIDDAVRKYDIVIEGAKITRDASIDVLVVGATVATGGTGGALLAISGAAGTVKGYAKFRDTDNVGAAVVSGTVGAMTTLLKIPADKMPPGVQKAATEGVIVFLDVSGDIGSDLATGRPVQEALLDATIKQVSSLGIGKGMEKIGLESQLKSLVATRGFRTPVPSMIQPYAVEVTKKTAEKLTETGLKTGINAISGTKADAGKVVLSTANISDIASKLDYIIQKA